MTKRSRDWKLGTQAVHGGSRSDSRDADTPVAFPLFQAANFIQEFGTGDGLRYPRYGNAPNAELVQRRMAAIEGSEASLVLSSGQGATACALMALLRPGDHLVASAWVYGGTRVLLEEEFAALGIHIT